MNSGYFGNLYDSTHIFHSLAVLIHRHPNKFWPWNASNEDAEDPRRR